MIRLESQHEFPFPREAIWPGKTDWLNYSFGLVSHQMWRIEMV